MSLDVELAWGRIASGDLPEYLPAYRRTRAIVRRLLGLFARHDISATWAVVGYLWGNLGQTHLREVGRFHPGVSADMISRLAAEEPSLIFAPDIVEAIQRCAAPQELASHSHSHMLFDDNTAPAELIDRDLSLAVETAGQWGVQLRSFVFPQNRVGRLALLRDHGFVVYRAPDRSRFQSNWRILSGVLRRTEHALALTPGTGCVRRGSTGLVAVPGGMLFRQSPRLRNRFGTMESLVRRARKGINSAVREQSAFHLWFHPFNFAYREEEHFRALERVLAYASHLRDSGLLGIVPMQQAPALIAESC